MIYRLQYLRLCCKLPLQSCRTNMTKYLGWVSWYLMMYRCMQPYPQAHFQHFNIEYWKCWVWWQGLYSLFNIIHMHWSWLQGRNCEIDLNSCRSAPCQNGGSCENEPDGFYVCTCPPGYTGFNCDSEVTQRCLSSPCNNQGTCVVSWCNSNNNYYGKKGSSWPNYVYCIQEIHG